jgi:SPP1 gp7 family putative phage head morphogenesis protein
MAAILRSPATHAAAIVSLEKAIREIADLVWEAWRGALGRDYARALRARGDKSIGEGADIKTIPPSVRSQLEAVQRQLVGRMTEARIGAAVDRAGEDVHRSNRASLDRQVETVVGRRFRSKPRIGDALRSYRAEAVKRISSVRDSVIPTITKDVAHAYANGWSDEQLAKHWEENGLPVEYGTVEGRARVIATTELGRLNMQVTREVHRSLGIETYRWRHSGKARYRPVHKARDGKIYSWKAAPSGGHPGNEPGCGCGADAVLDDETIDRISEGGPDATTVESPTAPMAGRGPAIQAAQPMALAQRPKSVAQAMQAESIAKRAASSEAHSATLAEQRAAKQAEERAAALAKRKAEEAARRAAEEQARHEAAKRAQAEVVRREELEARAREIHAQEVKVPKPKRAPKVVDPEKAAKAAARKAARAAEQAEWEAVVRAREAAAVRAREAVANLTHENMSSALVEFNGSELDAQNLIDRAIAVAKKPRPFEVDLEPESSGEIYAGANEVARKAIARMQDLSRSRVFGPVIHKVEDGEMGDAQAWAYVDGTTKDGVWGGRMGVRADFDKNVRRTLANSIDAGWVASAKHPKVVDAYVNRGDIFGAAEISGRQIMVHEYGHTVHFSLDRSHLGRALHNRYMDAYRASTREERASVSEYALTDQFEFFAECYALATSGQWDLIPERFHGIFKVVTAEK